MDKRKKRLKRLKRALREKEIRNDLEDYEIDLINRIIAKEEPKDEKVSQGRRA